MIRKSNPAARERILIVEDESLIAEEIRDRLESMGYRVAGLEDTAAGAIESATATQPDLILMDIRLKDDTDGIEAAEHIYRHLSIPSVFVTAHSDHDTIQRARRSSQFGYVLKPLEEGALEAAIEIALQRHALDVQLKSSQITQAAMIECASDAIVSHDLNGIIQSWNPAAERLFGFPAADAVGRSVVFLIPETNTDELVATLERVRQGHAIEFQSTGRRRSDGSIKEMWVRTSPIRNGKGDVIGAVKIARDVSEQKRAERELRNSEKRLRTIVEGMPVLLLALDEQDVPIAWSRECERVSGYSADEIIGNTGAMEALYPDAAQRDSMLQLFHLGGAHGHIWRLTCKDGSVRSVEWFCVSRALPIPGWARWSVGVDITKRLKLEEQLRQSQKLEGLGRLAGGVAHDFNNLLAVINGYSDLILRKMPEAAPERLSVNHIRTAGRKAADLTKQLLAFGRHPVVQLQPLNLNVLLAEDQPILKRAAGDTVDLIVESDPALGMCMADSSQIHQVLMNLVVNARDAMPAGGTIFIQTTNFAALGTVADSLPETAGGQFVKLSVSDSGTGISPDILDRIFDPFFTTKAGGTGLGLAIVYASVKQCGGSILVTNHPGKGAVFSVYFPRTFEDRQPQEPAAADKTTAAQGETILLVEDQPEIRSLVKSSLDECGYTILEAESGEEALKRAAGYSGRIHLVLTDVIMPGMTGVELAAKLKRMRPDTKSLFMSGYAVNLTQNSDLLDPDEPCIPKPFGPDELAARVRQVLSQNHV